MNCLTARETLDLIRPGALIRPDAMGRPEEVHGCDTPVYDTPVYDTNGNEIQGATVDEAAQHVKGCPACQTAVRRREKIDERIGQLSRDVPVPEGLRERLLAGLSKAGTAESRASPSGVAGKLAVRSRRRLWVSSVAACVAVLAAVGVWHLWVSHPASLSLDEIAGYALSDDVNPAADLPVQTQFKSGLAILLPKTIVKGALPLMQPFRQLVDPQLGDREIAVSFFTLANGKRGKFSGVLVIVPVAVVKDPPTASSFPAQTVYRGGYCTTAWVEGKYMYLCCVRGGERELHLLRQVTQDAA